MRTAFAAFLLLVVLAPASGGPPPMGETATRDFAGALAKVEKLTGEERLSALRDVVEEACAFLGKDDKLAERIWTVALASRGPERSRAVLHGIQALSFLQGRAVASRRLRGVLAAEAAKLPPKPRIRLWASWLPVFLGLGWTETLDGVVDDLRTASGELPWDAKTAAGLRISVMLTEAGYEEQARDAFGIALSGSKAMPQERRAQHLLAIATKAVEARLGRTAGPLLDLLASEVVKLPERERLIAARRVAALCRRAGHSAGRHRMLDVAVREAQKLGTVTARLQTLKQLEPGQPAESASATLRLASVLAVQLDEVGEQVGALLAVAERQLVRKDKTAALATLEKVKASAKHLTDANLKLSADLRIAQVLAAAGDASAALALGRKVGRRLKNAPKYWSDVYEKAFAGGDLRGAAEAATRLRSEDARRDALKKVVRRAIREERFQAAREGIQRLAKRSAADVVLGIKSPAGANLVYRVDLMQKMARVQARNGDTRAASATLATVKSWFDAQKVRLFAVGNYLELAEVQHELGLALEANTSILAALASAAKDTGPKERAENYARIARMQIEFGSKGAARQVLDRALEALPSARRPRDAARKIASAFAALEDFDKARPLLSTWPNPNEVLMTDLIFRKRFRAAVVLARSLEEPDARDQALTRIAKAQVRNDPAGVEETLKHLPNEAVSDARIAVALDALSRSHRASWSDTRRRVTRVMRGVASADVAATLAITAAEAGDFKYGAQHLDFMRGSDDPAVKAKRLRAHARVLDVHLRSSWSRGRWTPRRRQKHFELLDWALDRIRGVVAVTDDLRLATLQLWASVARSGVALRMPWYVEVAHRAGNTLASNATEDAARRRAQELQKRIVATLAEVRRKGS